MKWHKRFLEEAKMKASWSKDPSTKVGCVLVNTKKQIVGAGYNGFPRAIADDDRLHDREEKYPLIIHAEMNALLDAGRDAENTTLYIWGFNGPPCQNCTKHVIQAGIKQVVFVSGECDPRWMDELNKSTTTLLEAGVVLTAVEM